MKNYKNIGLVIALEDESLNILKDLGDFKKEFIYGYIKIKHFVRNNLNIYIAHSGIGEIYSAITTTLLINNFNIDLIFNFGLVGSLDKNIKLNDIVLVDEIIHYDYNLNSIDKDKEGIYFNKSNKIFKIPKLKILKDLNLNYVRIASGDKFISENSIKNNLIKNHNCKICDMESAGINIVCENFNIDRIFLKCVSDNADSDADINFKEIIKKGVYQYIQIINKILNNLK